MATRVAISGKNVAQAESGGPLRRRGLIAGAAALVAGAFAASLTLDTDRVSMANTNSHGPGALPPWSATFTVHPVFSVNKTPSSPSFRAMWSCRAPSR